MKPTRLTATNYVRFPSLDVTFTEGSTAIVGSNGAGKSAVLRAVELALFAEGSRDLAQWLAPFSDRMEITLEFSHAGERYRVRRGYKGGASAKATLDFEGAANFEYTHGILADQTVRAWVPLTLNDAKSTQRELERILGLNRRTFGASAYLAQGQSGAFTEASPAERKGIVIEAVDPRGYWPEVAQQATEERKTVERALEADHVRMGERTGFLANNAGIEERYEEAKLTRFHNDLFAQAAEKELEQAQAAVAENAAAVERLKAAALAHQSADIELARANRELLKAKAEAELLEPARVELAELEVKAAKVGILEGIVQERQRAHAEVALVGERKRAAEAKASQLGLRAHDLTDSYKANLERTRLLRERIDALRHAEDGTERCSHCKQILDREARQEAITSLRREFDALLDGNDEAEPLMQETVAAALAAKEAADAIMIPELAATNGYDDELRAARAAAEKRAGVAERIRQIQEHADRIPTLLEAYGEAELWLGLKATESARLAAETQDDAELTRTAATARAAQTQARTALDEANAQVTRLEEQLARVNEARKELAQLKLEVADAQDWLDLLRLAERAFGRDGIPTLIVENTLAQIETNANTYLAMMPTADGTTLRVQLETQRTQKTVENLKETLDVLVSDADGTRPYETYSGGERARVDIALRLALAILLADRRGAESRLLAVDELEGLDAEGQAQLVEVIRSVSARFDVICLASHYTGIRDAFDQTLQVVKEDGISRIVVA